ncbi:phospholipase D [Entamoeba marina]
MTVQIVRSICKEAGGLDGIERSVYESLLRVILRAKHYIYIEQQFFISNYGSERVWNLVVAMIADQIIKAFKKGDDFKAIFLVPMWSEGTLDSSITMFMGSLSLFERLKQAGIQDVNKYVYINNIVSIGMTKSTGLTVAPIYVHSKCIIVDDRYVIIGSANINDRSLKGDRDTELAAVIVDSKKVLSQMDGKHFQANSFAFELRLRLWGEHMGIDDSTLMMLKDPIQTINTMWSPLANKNTLLLENAFPTYPRNSIKRFNNWYDNVYPSLKVDQSEIVDFKGHLVNMPLEFGIKECQLLSVGNSIVQ